MNYRYYSPETPARHFRCITHVYCYVEYSVLIVQLPQHCTCKTKHHIPYAFVPIPNERKQFHENECNSHESSMVPITYSTLI